MTEKSEFGAVVRESLKEGEDFFTKQQQMLKEREKRISDAIAERKKKEIDYLKSLYPEISEI